MKLSVAPLSGHHDRKTLLSFYKEVGACAQIDRAYLGELFCAKRLLPLDAYQESVIHLLETGKEPVFSTMALPADEADFESAVSYIEAVDTVEINNLGYVPWLRERFPGKKFMAGPICNLYNLSDLSIVRDWGATGVSQHVDLLPGTIEEMVKSGILPVEVFLYGRPPIAFSWRCYTVRFTGKKAAACGSECRRRQDIVLKNLEDADGFIIDGPAVLPGRVVAPIDTAVVYRDLGANMGRLWLRPGEVDKVAALFESYLKDQITPSDMRNKLTEAAGGRLRFKPVATRGLS